LFSSKFDDSECGENINARWCTYALSMIVVLIVIQMVIFLLWYVADRNARKQREFRNEIIISATEVNIR
jgi:hypothetical protein